MISDKKERIRRRAYEIWESEGCPEGAALRNWQEACDELGSEDEHEIPQDLRDDRDDAALLQGAGESGDIDRGSGKSPRAKKSQKSVPSTKPAAPDGTTGEKPSRQKFKKTGGP